MRRREFIGTTAAAALTASAAYGVSPSNAPLPRRPYKDGIELSIIGLGGIVVCGMPQKRLRAAWPKPYDRGVNYFDCAPTYFDGEAEMKLGKR